MTLPIASKTLAQIRASVGYNVGAITLGTVTATSADLLSLVDTYTLAVGGTNDYKGRHIKILTATQDIADEVTYVTSFTGGDCTIAPALTAVTTKGDTYEMWAGYRPEEVDDKINQAIIGATDDILIDKETHSTVKWANKYEYNCLSSFVGLHRVEYVYSTAIDTLLHSCSTVWDELSDTDVTPTADTTIFSAGANKFVVADACAAGDILGTDDITSTDITDCDELVFSIYSTTALDAGDLDILLGDTASCASTVEAIDVPATSAYTKTRHVVSLANPSSDSAVISVGLQMVVDKDAFTVYISDIRAQHSKSRVYRELSHNLWTIVKATTPLLKLSSDGYGQVANNQFLRLTGYAIPAELSADATACTIDPDYVISRATALLLMSHARGREVDPDERLRRADWFMARSNDLLRKGETQLAANTRLF